jgi:cysteinyl-tRNA synthetase
MLKLYNTLTRKEEEFKPIAPDKITLYTCGPTVYDYQHIGNFRKFVFDDTLKRTLQVYGYNVQHVMNITDVGHLVSDADEGEDKLEKGAAREGKSVWEVANYYTDVFKQDAKSLNILDPNAFHGKTDNYARATDFISDQIDLVKILLDKNFAYITEQAIYFDVAKLTDYGVLTGQKLSEKEVAVREEVVSDKNKHHPQDFAIWFFLAGRYANHIMHWPSPWGDGFPGWHLECSAIIHKTLSDPIDIHTGGVDNIGTHHTNEMAQTEAAYGNKLANYWMHSEHLLVDGQKMSKSLKNFYTVKDIIEKGFDPLALRLLYLQGHYRTQINFTWENLASAQNRLRKFRNIAELRHQLTPQSEYSQQSSIERSINDIKEKANEDLNTPEILSTIESEIDEFEHSGLMEESKDSFTVWLKLIDDILGLKLEDSTPNITKEQKILITEREEARKNQDWQKADELRAELEEQGIEINDTAHGPIWYRK